VFSGFYKLRENDRQNESKKTALPCKAKSSSLENESTTSPVQPTSYEPSLQQLSDVFSAIVPETSPISETIPIMLVTRDLVNCPCDQIHSLVAENQPAAKQYEFACFVFDGEFQYPITK